MVKTKLSIIFIVTQSDLGGAQRYIFDLATNLNPQKFTTSVAAGSPKVGDGPKGQTLFSKFEETQNIETGPIKVHQLRYLKRQICPYTDLRAFYEIKELIETEQPDIIHLNSTKAGIIGSLAARAARTTKSPRIIYTAHGWVFNEPLPWWLKQLYLFCEKQTAKLKDKIICVSEYDRQIALQYKIAPIKKLVTIHNGLNWQELKFYDKQEATNKLKSFLPLSSKISSPLIGTIANLYPTKGLKYLIRAAKHLKIPYKLIIIGEGPERKSLEWQIKQNNLQNKIFLIGAIPEAVKYLKAFDLFILPSVKEGFPYTILEAIAAGLPIIANKVGGIPEIIDNEKNGLLIAPKNSKLLTKKIIYLLDNFKITQHFKKNCLKQIKKFSLTKMLKETQRQY